VTLRILAVTAEAFPLAKTGGLGDAVSGLCEALDALGMQVTIMLPGYRGVMDQLVGLREVAHFEHLPGGTARLFSGRCPKLGLTILVLKNDTLFDRDSLYCDGDEIEYADNGIRFASLSMAAALVAEGRGGVARPQVVHVHDWHAALTPLYMKRSGVTDVKTLLTLHNLAFQGVFPLQDAQCLGLGPRDCTPEGAECWGRLNFLKAGIQHADRISVVSQNYAREILTPQFGCGLDGALAARGPDLISIPNGISDDCWNPQADPYLGSDCFDQTDVSNKQRCKYALQQRFGLHCDPATTVMAMGSRLTEQKMADVAVQAIPIALESHPGLQVCVIGRGKKQIEAELEMLARRYPGRLGVAIGYDEETAHRLHAGADVLLHASRFEPFGLTPLYAMRYGTIPIGSRVGGMVDTIRDPGSEASTQSMRDATGLLFDGEAPTDMIAAIDRAMALRGRPDVWAAMQRNAMRVDFGWGRTAPSYIDTYRTLCRPLLVPKPIVCKELETDAVLPGKAMASIDVLAPLSTGQRIAGKGRRRVAAARRSRSDALGFPDSASVA